MRLVILDDYDLASEWAAKYIRNRIIQFNPSAEKYFTLGLPTGERRFFVFFFVALKKSILKYCLYSTVYIFFSGSTPYGCYRKLIEFYKSGDLSFKYVKTFNMDEYVGEFKPRLHRRLVKLCSFSH